MDTQQILKYYMKNPDKEAETHTIAQISYFRNRLEYYGEDVPAKFYTKNKEEFGRIIKLISGLIGNTGAI